MQVNRYLKDKPMDRIDHALGRPADPMAESCRNYFCANENSPEAEEFRASPNWTARGERGGYEYFSVSREGRAALAAHLRAIGDENRLFNPVVDGVAMSPVVAGSHSAARYKVFMALSDARSISFREFCDLKVSVRLASGRSVGTGCM